MNERVKLIVMTINVKSKLVSKIFFIPVNSLKKELMGILIILTKVILKIAAIKPRAKFSPIKINLMYSVDNPRDFNKPISFIHSTTDI